MQLLDTHIGLWPLAYVLGPGPEFIPYFMALLAVIGAAFVAAIQWPVAALLSWLKGKRRRGGDAETTEPVESETPRDVDRELTP